MFLFVLVNKDVVLNDICFFVKFVFGCKYTKFFSIRLSFLEKNEGEE